MSMPEEKVIVPLDSQKTFRIFENLFGNIAKYALPGTRVKLFAIASPSPLPSVLREASPLTNRSVSSSPDTDNSCAVMFFKIMVTSSFAVKPLT